MEKMDLDERWSRAEKLKARLETCDRSKINFCCDYLHKQVTTKCQQHGYNCPDWLIGISAGLDLQLHWYGRSPNASYSVDFCPWCGNKLPSLLKLLAIESDISKRVIEIIHEQTGLPDNFLLTLETTIDTIGMDSLDELELIMVIEEEFQIEIPDEIVEKYEVRAGEKTIGDIVEYITENLKPRALDSNVYDKDFLQGMRDGVSDRAEGSPTRYLAGDQLGADSSAHARYMDGYICGYA